MQNEDRARRGADRARSRGLEGTSFFSRMHKKLLKSLRMFVIWFPFFIDLPGCSWRWISERMNGGGQFSEFIMKKSAGEGLTASGTRRHT